MRLRIWIAVDLGDRAFTVLHLPGHSPGSIALFDEHDGTLFSGDVLYDDVLLDTIAGADPGEYGASLRRLRGMPVRTVRPGHGPSFGLRLMRTIIDRHLASRVTAAGTSQERPGPARAHQIVARLRAGGRGRAEPAAERGFRVPLGERR